LAVGNCGCVAALRGGGEALGFVTALPLGAAVADVEEEATRAGGCDRCGETP
jgi:hypothetical protein